MNITINIEGHLNNVLENLIHKGIVKTKSEAIRLGLLNLEEKYGLSLSKEEYYLVAQNKFKKIWDKEPEGVWESYLNESV